MTNNKTKRKNIARSPSLDVLKLLYTLLAGLFNRIPSQLLWEAFSNAAPTARRLFIYTICIARNQISVEWTDLPKIRNDKTQTS